MYLSESVVTALTTESVVIPGPVGKLEAVLEIPANARTDVIGVICHPHPQFGGTMTNKVLYTLARAMHEHRVPTLRFNYRGVGGSEGQYDDGVGETDDALAAIDWMRARWPNAGLWLAGFSFGGGVALRASVRTDTARLVTIAPAAARQPAPAQLPTCPWLVVQGSADDVIPARMVLDWLLTLPINPDAELIEGAGHFFHGQLNELRQIVSKWLGAGSPR